jgi:hypothetical protein
MDQVRLKAVQYLANDRNVARKRRVEAKILLQRERKNTSRQFQGPHIAILDKCLTPVSGPDTEKWQIPPSREGLEVPAGVRNSVHLME